MNKIFLCIIFSLGTLFYSCQMRPKITNEARMDSLVQKILNTEFIYCRLDSVPLYLVSGDIIKPGKIFTSFDSLKINVTELDSIKDKYVDWIQFNIAKVNSDTTDIHLEVNYTASMKNFMNFQKLTTGNAGLEYLDSLTEKSFYEIDSGYIHVNTKFSQFNFKLDSTKTNWKLIGSTSEYMH